MKRIIITNEVDGRLFGQILSDDKVDPWINNCVENNYWGLPERLAWADEAEFSEDRVLSEEMIVDPETQAERRQVILKADYVVSIEDVTAEYQAEIDAKEERKTEIHQMKQAMNVIDESDLPNWHKKILKRLIKELRD